ncbi:MAG: metallophosphoesterase [Promethearchaeota archaeon]|jgi:hypothetical protein
MIKRKSRNAIKVIILLIVGVSLSICTISIPFSNTRYLLEKTPKSEIANLDFSNQGFINSSDQNIFWFIHITDTQFVWSASEKISIFNQLLNESFQEINPLFIYNTGDLVDANYGIEQDVEEWKLYNKSLVDNNMNSSIYLDLIGNHDAAQDSSFNYYLNYSMIGRSFKTLQYSFNKSFSFGKYAFIGLNTAKSSYNLVEFAFQGFLNSTELDWYEKELEKFKNFDRIFVFGHHPHNTPPPYVIVSDLSSSGKSFFNLNEEFNVFTYLSGHSHVDHFQNMNGILMISTRNFDLNGGSYRIVSLDHNQLSTTIEHIGNWPQGIITNPPIENSPIQNYNKIRILAWDPNGINTVKWSLYSSKTKLQITNWEPLINIDSNEPLWEGELDDQLNGKYVLKVKIEGGSGEVIKEITFTSQSYGNFGFLIIFVFTMIGLISISIICLKYSKDHISKFKKVKEL